MTRERWWFVPTRGADIPAAATFTPMDTANEDLEHESGLRPLGEYPDHCYRCRMVAERRAHQAACAHESVSQVKRWGSGAVVLRSCADCGLPLDEERP